MELPTNTKGAVDETRLIIEGKLVGMGRDPLNVQVLVAEDSHGREFVSLRDVGGVFVEAGALEKIEKEEESTGNDEGSRGEEEGELEMEETSEHGDPSIARELAASRTLIEELETRNEELTEEVSCLGEEVSKLSEKLERETERVSEMWKLNCAQVASFDEAVVAKDAEIEQLKLKISGLEARTVGGAPVSLTVPVTRPPISVPRPSLTRFAASGSVATESAPIPLGAPTSARRGKAPPVNEFSGEDPECPLDDWLPSLERAIAWNDWSEEERMIQLAGYLKGRALQEWNLLQPEERASFTRATEALHLRLDSGSRGEANMLKILPIILFHSAHKLSLLFF